MLASLQTAKQESELQGKTSQTQGFPMRKLVQWHPHKKLIA